MVTSIEQHDWYDTPRYYDLVFAGGTEKEAAFLAQVHEQFGRSGGMQVLEAACGSGRLMEAMVKQGFYVTGFDLNPYMCAFTKQRMRAAGVISCVEEKDMAQFSYEEKFDLAHCLVSTFKYLSTEQDALSHLECMADSLKSGGIYVLGLHLTDYKKVTTTQEVWFGQQDNLRVICNIQTSPAYRTQRLEKMRSRLSVYENRRRRNFETRWSFRTYSTFELQDLLIKVPLFEHVATYDFGYDVQRPIIFETCRYDCILILRRK